MKGEGEKWGGKKRKKNPSQNKLLPLKTSPDFQIRACTCVCMADAGLAWSVSQQVLKGLPRSHPSKAFQILRGADNCKYFLCWLSKNKQAKQPSVTTSFTSHLKLKKPHLVLSRTGSHVTLLGSFCKISITLDTKRTTCKKVLFPSPCSFLRCTDCSCTFNILTFLFITLLDISRTKTKQYLTEPLKQLYGITESAGGGNLSAVTHKMV